MRRGGTTDWRADAQLGARLGDAERPAIHGRDSVRSANKRTNA